MDLFKMNYNLFSKLSKPLAERMRPKDLSFFIGQDNIIKNNSVLKNMIKNNRFSSMILYGPPGSGKTSLANIISSSTDNYFVKISAVTSGTKEIKEIIELAKDNLSMYNKRTILFIDEIHTLMGSKGEALDFANMFKPGLDRGDIKVIGATTTEEYERYILRDKAFVRRFQKVIVEEPTREQNIQICLGTLPKIEKRTGAEMMYSNFVKQTMMEFLTDITSEYKRVYEIGSRYPDVTLTLIQDAFSYAMFDNRKYVNVLDFRKAIENCKNIYPDVITKSLPIFDETFRGEIEDARLNMIN